MATLAHFHGVVLNGVAAVPGAHVYVRREDNLGRLATIWNDQDETDPAANYITADERGRFDFYARGGFYRIRAEAIIDDEPWVDEWENVSIGTNAATDVDVGRSGGTPLVFEEETADAAPAQGGLRFSASLEDEGDTGFVYVSELNVFGGSIDALIESFDRTGGTNHKGTIRVQSAGSGSTWREAVITGAVIDAVNYKKVPIEFVDVDGTFTAGDPISLIFTPAGPGQASEVSYGGHAAYPGADTVEEALDASGDKLQYVTVTSATNLDTIRIRVESLDAAVVLRGSWDASAGTFPNSGGGGTAGAVIAGDSFIVSVSGTVGGVAFTNGDRLIAITDAPSTTVYASNWFKADYTDLLTGLTLGAALAACSAKTTPVDADVVGFGDSAASGELKKVTWANIKATLWAAWGALIAGGTNKSTPVDADEFAISDSAASNATKKLSLANLKTAIFSLMTTRGDMIRRGASGAERFAKGTEHTILKMGANDPDWSTLTALFDAVFGSTRGAILLRGDTGWEKLNPGTSGFVLTSNGSGADPSYAEPEAGGGGDVTKAQLAERDMQLAQLLGGRLQQVNCFAEPFASAAGVDAPNSTNELIIGGTAQPTATGTPISGATGTTMGTMINSGGIASAFNGVTNAAVANSARSAAANSYVGKNYSASPKRIQSVQIYGSNDQGYMQSSNPSTTWNLYAKQGGAPGSGTDGTLLGSVTFTDGTTADTKIITSNDPNTLWDYVWMHNALDNSILAEVVFSEATGADNLDLRLVASDIPDVPLSVDVYAIIEETDSLTVNTDLKIYGSRTGSAWEEGTEQKIEIAAGFYLWQATGIDVSGQSSADDIAARFVSANNKRFRIHAVAVYGRP
ncbi:hypothetical protein IZ6_07830 [Terrihabitans soli]|uniref:Uncharacterized protein n=1 Tax=Terrihabitans soli TaxID=708113 RepID=A0A6S6QU95_9HYPH|nr:hypothetical protein [Terrihabitans soli]BCJ90048.1 hypothetical protein IZ6_07830 [Terrihabitans soli]